VTTDGLGDTLVVARATHVGAIVAMARETGQRGWSEPEMLRDVQSSASVVVCALAREHNDTLTGYVHGRVVADEAEILHLAVCPSRRRQGLGRRLLDEFTRRARERGASTVYLEVRPSNAPALALYERAGFTLMRTRPSYYRDPVEDALELAKSLGPVGIFLPSIL
jgi:ribosomal-protein-alanine N-acetyltransferase